MNIRDNRVLLVALSLACGALVAHTCMNGDRYQALGTPGAIAKFLSASSIGDSSLLDNGTVTTNTHPFNAPSYQVGGVTVMGAGGAAYSTTATLSVSETLGANTVNLSTVGGGTTDFIAPSPSTFTESCVAAVASKALGARLLACRGGVYAVLVQGNENQAGGNSAACPIGITWNAADTNTTQAPPGPTTCNFNNVGYFPNTTSDYGFQFVIPATTAIQVARIYTSVINSSGGAACDGKLTDGSGLTASTPSISAGVAGVYRSDTWTFAARAPGYFLTVYCHIGTPTGTSSSTAWLAVALGPT